MSGQWCADCANQGPERAVVTRRTTRVRTPQRTAESCARQPPTDDHAVMSTLEVACHLSYRPRSGPRPRLNPATDDLLERQVQVCANTISSRLGSYVSNDQRRGTRRHATQ